MNLDKKILRLMYPWDKSGYCPEVEFYPQMTETGFPMKIDIKESNPKRIMTEHFQPVHLDSCVEWFVNFSPKTSEYYFNFEVNANGVMNVAFRKNRQEYRTMTLEDIESLHIKTKIEETYWTVEYEVPFSLIEKYYDGFERKNEVKVLTNFYKCGDETVYPHYGVWKKIDIPEPDFHRPEFFGEVVFDRSCTKEEKR